MLMPILCLTNGDIGMLKNGFTLIELIVVICILGILSIVAVPKFIDTSNDALLAQLDSMEANIQSATYRVYAKAVLQDKLSGSKSVIVDGDSVLTHSGYPIGDWDTALRHVLDLSAQPFSTSICTSTWCGNGNSQNLPGGISSTTGRGAKITPQGYAYTQVCGVYYMNHNDGSKPQIGVLTSGC